MNFSPLSSVGSLPIPGSADVGGTATNRSVNILGFGGGTSLDFARILQIAGGDTVNVGGEYEYTQPTPTVTGLVRDVPAHEKYLPFIIGGALVLGAILLLK